MINTKLIIRIRLEYLKSFNSGQKMSSGLFKMLPTNY